MIRGFFFGTTFLALGQLVPRIQRFNDWVLLSEY